VYWAEVVVAAVSVPVDDDDDDGDGRTYRREPPAHPSVEPSLDE
jgi:hypothetical protein